MFYMNISVYSVSILLCSWFLLYLKEFSFYVLREARERVRSLKYEQVKEIEDNPVPLEGLLTTFDRIQNTVRTWNHEILFNLMSENFSKIVIN